MKDKINSYEMLNVNGKIYKSTTDQIIGEVSVKTSRGKTLFTKKIYRNDLLVTGSVYFLEKTYNIRSTFKPISLDVELGVNTEIITDSTTLKNEQIIGIVCGIGGSGDSYNNTKPIKKHLRTVEDIIPFRVTDIDRFDETRDDYFLRTYDTGASKFSFYGKKFVGTPDIKVEYINGVPVPNDVGDLPTAQKIMIYSQSNAYISPNDIREYFINRDGDTSNSRVNTIGLVAGYPIKNASGDTEYANVRTITALSMNNIDLKNSEDDINIEYKHYII